MKEFEMNEFEMKAFPSTTPLDSWDAPNQGMDLRDYFAAKALQGLLGAEQAGAYADEDVAKFSYAIADAMMKARVIPDEE